MKTKKSILAVPDAGKVSGEYFVPADAISLLVLAHGAGAGMHHVFMVTLAERLAAAGIATLRFNFPFSENGKGRPDTPKVAHQTISTALKHAAKSFPELPLFAGGKSFGGRMTSQYLSEHPDEAVKGIVFYGFPLHPAGKPSTERAAHLKAVTKPMLFLQGSKDTLAEWSLIEPVCAALPLATLVRLEGADHSFKAGKQDTIAVLTEATKNWINSHL
ncbi:alpha/beta hydrolase family protein [Flavihumibacter petaseus]|uniref:KANL3/Tex30 alpha/beta hydrolase-like domain-containing protein n=1 Tax=Flavihumibacter petaseus NBRC 106054 TaxID=1220578 RepID=A0A0E9MYQ2_9BACT|nr:alpha/beta family hydrolase [Flavihumibacter petaseus]GAO42643.1 hypothetical protein FPE01S_01_16580 [Flavihumibacter petaseus NBRC 106054]